MDKAHSPDPNSGAMPEPHSLPTTLPPPARLDAKDTQEGHLSETVTMQHWLSLLVVVSTCLLLALSVWVSVRVLSHISHTLLIFSLGALCAYALAPLVERARRRRNGQMAPRWVGVTMVFGTLSFLALVGGIVFSKDLVRQVGILSKHHVEIEAHMRRELANTDDWFINHNLHVHLVDYLNNPPPNVKSWGEGVSHTAVHTLESVSRSVVEGLIVLLISLYFLIYSSELRENLNRSLPPRLRSYAEVWENDINSILGGFVRGQAVLALVMGAMAAVACALLGVRLWLLIGLFVVVVSLIPVFGPYIGAVPACLSAAFTPEGHFLTPVARVVAVLVMFIILNEVGSKILYPRLVGAALGLHEVLVLFVLFAGLEVAGIWGVLFAAPLTALGMVTLIHLYRLWQGEEPKSVSQAAKQGGAKAKAEGTP